MGVSLGVLDVKQLKDPTSVLKRNHVQFIFFVTEKIGSHLSFFLSVIYSWIINRPIKRQ